MNAPEILAPRADVTTLSEEIRSRRARVVGASEVAALFGLSPYLTKFELWYRKHGDLPEVDLSDNDRVLWGVILEPAIAAGIAQKTGWTLRKYPGHAQHPTVAGMGASPDYEVIDHPRGRGVVQIKNVDALVFRDWKGEGGETEPPMQYQLQVQHEIACTGYAWGALAVLVGGNSLHVFEYDRHDGVIAKLEAEVAKFWQSIEADAPPEPDFLRDLETIRDLYGSALDGEVVDLSGNPRVAELCAAYSAAGEAEKSAKEAKDAAKAELLTLIGEAEIAFAGDWKVSAKVVPGGPVSYVREPYRGFRVTATKSSKKSKGGK